MRELFMAFRLIVVLLLLIFLTVAQAQAAHKDLAVRAMAGTVVGTYKHGKPFVKKAPRRVYRAFRFFV